jgi:hypothetical protein
MNAHNFRLVRQPEVDETEGESKSSTGPSSGTSGSQPPAGDVSGLLELDRIRILVLEHRICWRVLPKTVQLAKSRPICSGLEIELESVAATGGPAATRTRANWPASQRELLDVASWVSIWDAPDTEARLQRAGSTLSFTLMPPSSRRLGVVITVNSNAATYPTIDARQSAHVYLMKERLRLAGVRPDAW